MRDSSTSELINAIRAKQCVPFIGAGMSKASGMPLWSELIGQMKPFLIDLAETAGDKEEESKYLDQANYLDIATRYKFKAGLGNYHKFLQERYRLDKSQPTKVHHALARIHSWPFAITTNFDKLLEASFTRTGFIPPAIVTEPDELIISIRSGKFFILKLHGDIDRPQSIVLTRDEYDQFLNSQRGQVLLESLRQQLMFRTVLFIGFGLNDPNFLRVFGEVGWLARGYQGDAFSIMANTTKPEREEWQRRRLHIISLTDHEELASFLNELADKVIGIGSNVVIFNALAQDFESPKQFLTNYPFFQVSSKWPCDFVREQLGTSHSAFSASLLESDEIWEPFETTFHELGRTNHILVTVTQPQISGIPESFWQRMPCERDVLLERVGKEGKVVFGVKETNGLYTLLVAATGDESLRTALSDFIALATIPSQ